MAEVIARHSKAALLALAILAAAVIVVVVRVWPCFTTTTVMLVRHAEKEASPGNPSLTDQGDARAVELAEVAEEAGVTAIYATEFCRTVLTARPLAEALGLTIRVQQHPSGGLEGATCSPPIPPELVELLPADNDTEADLIDHVLAHNRNGAVLVVGHSNTVPDLVAELGEGAFDLIADLGTYDRLFVVTRQRSSLYPWLVVRRLIQARYGQS